MPGMWWKEARAGWPRRAGTAAVPAAHALRRPAGARAATAAGCPPTNLVLLELVQQLAQLLVPALLHVESDACVGQRGRRRVQAAAADEAGRPARDGGDKGPSATKGRGAAAVASAGQVVPHPRDVPAACAWCRSRRTGWAGQRSSASAGLQQAPPECINRLDPWQGRGGACTLLWAHAGCRPAQQRAWGRPMHMRAAGPPATPASTAASRSSSIPGPPGPAEAPVSAAAAESLPSLHVEGPAPAPPSSPSCTPASCSAATAAAVASLPSAGAPAAATAASSSPAGPWPSWAARGKMRVGVKPSLGADLSPSAHSRSP